MALVDDQQRILRQVVEQAGRRLAGAAPGQVARVVLDAGAVAHLHHHLEVEGRALLEPLRLEQLAEAAQLDQPLPQLLADLVDRRVDPLARRHVVRRRKHGVARELAQDLARQRVEQRQRLDLVVEELHANGFALGLRGKDVDDVAAHAIRALRQVELVARVLHVGEPAQELALVEAVAAIEVQHHAEIRLRIAQAVDRGDRGDDDRVRPLEQRLGRRQPHLLDVGVDRGVLLDVRVGRRHVGLGLVVVVVADEVLDRVVREELAELAVELRGERLVVRHHQCRPLHALDDIGDGVGLPGARDSQQRLAREAALEAADEPLDGLGLVARRPVVGPQSKGSGNSLIVMGAPFGASQESPKIPARSVHRNSVSTSFAGGNPVAHVPIDWDRSELEQGRPR